MLGAEETSTDPQPEVAASEAARVVVVLDVAAKDAEVDAEVVAAEAAEVVAAEAVEVVAAEAAEAEAAEAVEAVAAEAVEVVAAEAVEAVAAEAVEAVAAEAAEAGTDLTLPNILVADDTVDDLEVGSLPSPFPVSAEALAMFDDDSVVVSVGFSV
jgi:regulator of protease activity HflC (stomatin/prohibitin superfamily)